MVLIFCLKQRRAMGIKKKGTVSLDSGWLGDTVSFSVTNLGFSATVSVSLGDGGSASSNSVTSSLGETDLWSGSASFSGFGKVARDCAARVG